MTFIYPNYLNVQKPENLDQIIDIAKKLCKGFYCVRVDLDVQKDKIYFGELTFTGGSGIFKIEPYEFDKKLGDLIKLPK